VIPADRAAAVLRSVRAFGVALLFAFPIPAAAQEIDYAISGIPEPLLSNVRRHLTGFGITGRVRTARVSSDRVVSDAERGVREALKPYGYYRPDIRTNLVDTREGGWRVEVYVDPGPPVRVRSAKVELRGDGERQEDLREWRAAWPLREGAVLDQAIWEAQKETGLAIAEEQGYINARFIEHRIAIDPAANEADLSLLLDTGRQAVFGDVRFEQDVIRPWILENVPRFSKGTLYRPDLVDSLRLDLWKTGYFTDIRVEEERRAERDPPEVEVVATMESEFRSTYQGTLGFGTDTGYRAQAMWRRHPLSSRGDRLDLRAGYQQTDDEFTLRADYRIPRRADERQFWISHLILRQDRQDLEFKRNEDDEAFITLAPGSIEDLLLRAGRLEVKDRRQGQDQYFETIFAQYLRESYEFDPGPDAHPQVRELLDDPRSATLFRDTVQTLALGMEWDWPAVRGSGFETSGIHDRAWIFTSNGFWGSDRDFSQLYISTRRNFLHGERWKLLLRAEAGYTDADVDELTLTIEGEPLALSITELPNQYRFKAGGSGSVRGYAFEELSNNDVGSNHIVAASVEVEMRIFRNWSAAAFVDAGNAFNDWNEFELRRGAGVGIRWYSVAGPIRLDVARALDFEGRPWRLHFSIGTPLL
jgi:translocation and assembly module TamA